MRMIAAVISLTLLVATMVSASATDLMTEREARLAAAEFVQGPMFSCVDLRSVSRNSADYAKCTAGLGNPRATPAKTAEILSHIRDSLLVIRGDTHYCGGIREPTWILLWDSADAAKTWFGGYPVMVNARTRKVVDCRS